MQDSARIKSVIELLDLTKEAWEKPQRSPVDVILNRYFRDRRYIGSKDRGAISSLFYLIIRNFAALKWHVNQYDGDEIRPLIIAAMLLIQDKTISDLLAIFDGERFSPKKMNPDEFAFAKKLSGKALLRDEMPDYVRYNYPEWLEQEIQSSLGENWKQEIQALSEEAPVDLRTNTLLTTRDALLAELKKEDFNVELTKHSSIGIRMRERAPVFTSETFKKGWFEMQDEGSQIVSLMLDAKPGEKIIDFCAGAGGKTLAIAASMQNKGRILAWDISEKRLKQIAERLRRAKVDNVQTHVLTSENDAFIKRHKDSADAVIVDAPCSGSGTWRRNPDLKWRFNSEDLHKILETQKSILDSASRLVKVGGRLLYITCSILESENQSQVESFLKEKEKFRVVMLDKLWSNQFYGIFTQGGSIQLTPRKDGTDGFFATLLQRIE